jgi:2-iminobutanoate/2-iminopropanoate deaminase
MKKRIIETDYAPKPKQDGIRLPISQAVQAGDFVFVCGQIGADPKTEKIVAGGIEEQTKQSLENMKAVLAAAGLRLQDVVKATVFIRNADDFMKMTGVYGRYFRDEFPARICVVSSFTMKEMLVEMDAIAYSPRHDERHAPNSSPQGPKKN